VSALDFQLGVSDESVYGTIVTPTRFFDTYRNPDSITAEWGRIESEGMRPGQRVARSDRFAAYPIGASGDLEVEPLTRGFGFWLKHMLGAVTTTAGAAGEVNTHRATMGDLFGKSFTCQVGRPFNPSGTVQPFTYFGGKVTKWELSNSVEKLLVAKLSCDFQGEDVATALATASYPASAQVLSWAGAAVTIAGAAFEPSDISVSVDSGAKTDRRYLRGSALKREPVEQMRDVEFKMTAAFDGLSERNRVASATTAGALASIVATWTGPVREGTSTFPLLRVTIPAGRFDKFDLKGGPAPMEETLTGKAMWDGTNSPVTIDYLSMDATP